LRQQSNIVASVVLLFALLASSANAQTVPAKNQAALLMRILAYDRSLATRAGAEVTVAVIAREGTPESESGQAELAAALNELAKTTSVSGLKVRAIRVSYSTPEKLEATLGSENASAAYVTAGMTDALDALIAISRKKRILTFSAAEAYVLAGISLGFVRRDSKAAILVNLPAVKSEGANLDAALLKIAEVVKK
jgi:hypothetical protein